MTSTAQPPPPPALCLLNNNGLINRYKPSAPILAGEFCRTVQKKNQELLRLVETGFDRRSSGDIHFIHRKGDGSSPWKNPRLLPFLIGFVALLLMLLLLIWTRTLRRVLTHKTTELKSANERLRLANKQFRALFDNAAAGILVADPETQRFDFANPFIERILGYNPGELIGKSVADIHPAESLPQIQAGFEAQVRGDKTLIAKAPCQRKDGRIIYVDINAAPVSLNGKNHIMGLFSDITQRKLAEDALHAKNEEMDRFVYTASHDLKAPLITFQTYLGFLKQDLRMSNDAAIQQDIAFMHSAADRMKTLLDDLLTLSRVGRVVHPPESISFSNLVTDALRALAGPIATRRVEIVRAAPELILSGDRIRLVEIWQNLIDNAVKFMGDQPHPRIEIGWEATPAAVCFFVRDNGIGLDSAYHTQMFDLFEKLDPSSDGTGLGLALIKRIVELYHGRIWIESPGAGQGCCVRFTLPDAIPQAPPLLDL
jgi:PAS domain S-box-containing protein